MGQRQNQTEIVYGNDCSLKFAAGETPKYLYARFLEIETCPDAPATCPNDRVFKLTQDATFPCLWQHVLDGPFMASFEYLVTPLQSRLYLRHGLFQLYFYASEDFYTNEGYIFTNTNVVCGGWQIGKFGIGVVTWRLESIVLMKQLNIKTQNDLFMEMRPLKDGSRIYKYCRLEDATNIAIKYHPEVLKWQPHRK